mmetsp:Transcript_19818/g.53901  ORF Transcript_19818/g.53901 Transcript_19818/m.53901 type:complete len:416 (-) Transcript_19818:1698-2945(-)
MPPPPPCMHPARTRSSTGASCQIHAVMPQKYGPPGPHLASRSSSSSKPSLASATSRFGLLGHKVGVPVLRTSKSSASSRDGDPLELPLPSASCVGWPLPPSLLLSGDSFSVPVLSVSSASSVSSSSGSSSSVWSSASSSSSSSATGLPEGPGLPSGLPSGISSPVSLASGLQSASRRIWGGWSSTSSLGSRLKRAARSSCALPSSAFNSPEVCLTIAEVRTSSSSPPPSSSVKPSSKSGGLAGSVLGVVTGLSMSSQESRISGSFSFSTLTAMAGTAAMGAATSSIREAFTCHTPSRSSTRYFGTHVPLAPSPQMAPRAVAQLNHCCHNASWCKVLRLPMTMHPRRARVSITFKRRQSDKKPTLPSRLFRTAQKMMTSFSWPWKPSTDSTSSPERNFWSPGRSRMSFLMRLTWPL